MEEVRDLFEILKKAKIHISFNVATQTGVNLFASQRMQALVHSLTEEESYDFGVFQQIIDIVMQINDNDLAKNEEIDFKDSVEFSKIVNQGLVREEIRGDFIREYFCRYKDVVQVAAKQVI